MTTETVTLPSIQDVPDTAWEKLSRKTIYFGHQSVGNNVMEGVKDVIKAQPKIELKVAEPDTPENFTGPGLVHFPVGQNMNPQSKIDAFAKLLRDGVGQKADIAFFKFCYIDINRDTDIKTLFSAYVSAMDKLQKEYPSMDIVHMTVPLRVVQTGFKVPIKRLIGRPIGGYDDNAKRNEFNDLLKAKYDGSARIFDLAQIESTLPNGQRTTFRYNQNVYHALASEYTDDGGHLNGLGRKIVAEQLLVFLAQHGE